MLMVPSIHIIWRSNIQYKHQGRTCGDEELRAVGARPRIGHGQVAGACVLQLEVLVLKL